MTSRPFDFTLDAVLRLVLVVDFLLVRVPELPVLEVGIRNVSIHYL
jgi:hypothetical protein